MIKLNTDLFNGTMAALVMASKSIETMREPELDGAGIMIDGQIKNLNEIGENAAIDEDVFNGIMAALMAGSKIMETADDKRLAYVGIFIDKTIDELEGANRPELKKVIAQG